MQEVPKQKILSRIALENPWWDEAAAVPSTFTALRPRPYINLLYPLVRDRAVRRAPVLMGPRRVGKTYLIHHCIDRLLRDGVDPKHVCYISVDVPTYVNLSLERFLELYAEATGVSVQNEPTYIFFDEIQYLREWERHLKTLVDTFPLAKFVASGSAAAALRLKSRESGAGRLTDFLLPPLTFFEYLDLLGETDLVEVDTPSRGLRYSTE
nr:AAA family ATPase [Thermoanaerobaculia bacterium]